MKPHSAFKRVHQPGLVRNIDWDVVSREDRKRRTEVMGYLSEGKINDANSLYYAAVIFQHGNCPEHYKLANLLAEKAMQMGHNGARWLYAATLDRYHMSLGKPQKFGPPVYERGRRQMAAVFGRAPNH